MHDAIVTAGKSLCVKSPNPSPDARPNWTQLHVPSANTVTITASAAYLNVRVETMVASSMVGPKQHIDIAAAASEGALPTSHAVSVGLIVTELIINAIKYAFPERRASARIRVTFEMAKSDWKLTVADNGAGRNRKDELKASTGLGIALIGALAKQLKAQITETSSSTEGLTFAVTRSTFESHLPVAA